MPFRISCRSFLSGHLQPKDKETSRICFRTPRVFSLSPRLSPAFRWAVLKFLIPSTLQIMRKMLRIINIFFQGEVIYEGGLNRLPIRGPWFFFLEQGRGEGPGGRRMRGQPLSQNSSSGCLLTPHPSPPGAAGWPLWTRLGPGVTPAPAGLGSPPPAHPPAAVSWDVLLLWGWRGCLLSGVKLLSPCLWGACRCLLLQESGAPGQSCTPRGAGGSQGPGDWGTGPWTGRSALSSKL